MVHFIFAIFFIEILWSIFDKRFAKGWYKCRDYLPILGTPATGDLPSFTKAFRRVNVILLMLLIVIYILGPVMGVIPK